MPWFGYGNYPIFTAEELVKPPRVKVTSQGPTSGHGGARNPELMCLTQIIHKLSSVQFNHSVTSDSLRPHGLQHVRLSCPSPTPGVYSNSCPSSQWCHPTISSSVVPFPCTFNLSQNQGLFRWVSSLHKVAKGLEFHLQHQSFQWTLRTDLL